MVSVSIVEQQDLELAKRIAELQLSRKNLSQGLTQGKHNIAKIKIELRQLERAKWQSLRRERGY